MTSTVLTTSTIGNSVVYASVAMNDNVTLLPGLTFMNTFLNGITILHGGNTVLNMATLLSGGSYGLTVNAATDCEVTNTAQGTIGTLTAVAGYSGVLMAGDRNTLRNAGEIFSSNGSGVYFNGIGSIVENSGTISGGEYGVIAASGNYSILNSGTIESGAGVFTAALYLDGVGIGKTLVNSGLIRAMGVESSTAVVVAGGNLTSIVNTGTILALGGLAVDASLTTGAMHLTNSGVIMGPANQLFTVLASSQSDTIINTGTISRSVSLGGGDDLFDGTGGFVGGIVYGGDGSDTFHVSDTQVVIFEGEGEGTADHVLSTVSFALSAGSEIEALTLLGSATDGTGNEYGNSLTGSGMDNRLVAGLGNDSLDGRFGDDTLRGDGGGDLLLGGDGNDVLRGGAVGDSVYGGDGDDVLWGDAANDRLFGDAGEDVLIGGAGRDTLAGGAEGDTFRFRAVADTGVGATLRDIIQGFEAGLDVIDLTGMDAKSAVNGNQAFVWIGTAGFASVAGQLRLVAGVDCVLQGDVTGDGVADFEVLLSGVGTVSVNDVLL